MKRGKTVLIGLLLIALGVILGLNAAGITRIDLLFEGWWTLFIIVPCGIGLFTERDKVGNLIGVLVGVFLLLCVRDVLSFEMLWKLLLPLAVVLIGLKLVLDALFPGKTAKLYRKVLPKGPLAQSAAVFSGTKVNYDGQVFTGAELTADFGAVECDLRNAVILEDCPINVSATFGGITILVPKDVDVVTKVHSLFGGVSDETKDNPGAVTLYISGSCLFGGVTIR